ncbi:FtsB family cell division protein [Streptomyces sp. bgisy100]|uniref:FtsB family cell division protein n=1 Tax=Streptomyces sp. bgisy100 TaxID=3413783 RepID=UPI003D75EBE5
MAGDRERFSTATRLKALGEQAAARVYRAGRRAGPPRRSRLTGRAALLALVVCSLVVALAYPMRQFVSQRSRIAEQQRRAERARAEVERLRDEKARWQDPAYVERQAREHLHYVRPGETGYTVVREGGPDTVRSRDEEAAARPWYSELWDGVDRADAGHRTR